jgi:hypothetical protein
MDDAESSDARRGVVPLGPAGDACRRGNLGDAADRNLPQWLTVSGSERQQKRDANCVDMIRA